GIQPPYHHLPLSYHIRTFMERAIVAIIALFTIIRTDHNMLLLYHSHKHISYPIRTIARSAI
ncbi:hypothetical protein OZD68_02945, partial [Wolbachia endosymbiont of Drosophila bicornuta]|uniref:hypothetical protein n=1 Tax=Wolbachia endosymbiont of Drosophila bicornuta TaxID=375918 RepID=UPI0023A9D817